MNTVELAGKRSRGKNWSDFGPSLNSGSHLPRHGRGVGPAGGSVGLGGGALGGLEGGLGGPAAGRRRATMELTSVCD